MRAASLSYEAVATSATLPCLRALALEGKTSHAKEEQ